MALFSGRKRKRGSQGREWHRRLPRAKGKEKLDLWAQHCWGRGFQLSVLPSKRLIKCQNWHEMRDIKSILPFAGDLMKARFKLSISIRVCKSSTCIFSIELHIFHWIAFFLKKGKTLITFWSHVYWWLWHCFRVPSTWELSCPPDLQNCWEMQSDSLGLLSGGKETRTPSAALCLVGSGCTNVFYIKELWSLIGQESVSEEESGLWWTLVIFF